MFYTECTGSELGADGSKVSTAAPDAEEDQGYAKLSSQDQSMGFSFSSPLITNLHQLPHNVSGRSSV